MFSLFNKKTKKPDEVGSISEFFKKFEYFSENQRGKWLKVERSNAKKLAKHSLLSSVLTATFQRPIAIPVSMLKNKKMIGRNNDISKTEALQIKQIAALMKRGKWKWSEKNIPFINIEYNGEALINTGYAVICGAREAGKASIPVWLSYYVGGELARGEFSPNKIYKIYSR